MARALLPLAGLSIVLTAATIAGAQPGSLRERLRERLAAPMAEGLMEPSAPEAQEMAYGADPLQKLDYWPARKSGAPLIIFVHGGGWSRGDMTNATGTAKVTHLRDQGYAFASIDYRLVPKNSVEQQAADVATATAWLIGQARKLGFDPKRIVLMGHSAGAQLVALVGTDPHYLSAAGLSLNAVRGVVPLDGAAYDIPAQVSDGPAIMQPTYRAAFGTDPARQRSLSPTLQAAAPNAPAFLLLHVQRPDGVRQSEALAKALKAAGTAVTIQGFPGQGLQGHMEINRKLGDPAYPATPVLDDWLKQILAKG